MKILVLKPPGFRKLSHSSEMRNDAIMHREGLEVKTLVKTLIKEDSQVHVCGNLAAQPVCLSVRLSY